MFPPADGEPVVCFTSRSSVRHSLEKKDLRLALEEYLLDLIKFEIKRSYISFFVNPISESARFASLISS